MDLSVGWSVSVTFGPDWTAVKRLYLGSGGGVFDSHGETKGIRSALDVDTCQREKINQRNDRKEKNEG
jgi:hypothetical protein